MQTTQLLKEISPAEMRQRMVEGRGAGVVDVRTRLERDAVSVVGTTSIPLDELSKDALIKAGIPVDGPVYLLCQSGSRAKKAATVLERAGVDECICITGGIQGWIDAGLPVERGHSKVLPLQRQVQLVVGVISAIGAALALIVNPLFAIVPLITGLGLTFAGLSGICGLAILLARTPWNKPSKTACSSKLSQT